MSLSLSDSAIRELLSLVSRHEVYDVLWWDEDLSFFVNCNDAFAWACSDCEPITEDRIPLLKKALEDCESDSDGMLLYVARLRKMRPQGAMYKYIDKKFWPLFDACGPAREGGFGNPVGSERIEEYCSSAKAIDALTAPEPIQ